MNKDEIFIILSHPLRRKILSELYYNGSLKYKQMAEWGVSTGTLYHHLKTLGGLIEQSSQNYRLTEIGKEVCAWFLKDPSGMIKIKKINSQIFLTQNLIFHATKNSYLTSIFGLIAIIVGIFLANQLNLIIVGFFIIPNILSMTFMNLALFTGTIGFIFMYSIILGTIKEYKKTFAIAIISILPSYITIIIIFLLYFYLTFSLSLISWVVISIFSQIFFMFINSSALIIINGFNTDRAIIVSLLASYTFLFITITYLL